MAPVTKSCKSNLCWAVWLSVSRSMPAPTLIHMCFMHEIRDGLLWTTAWFFPQQHSLHLYRWLYFPFSLEGSCAVLVLLSSGWSGHFCHRIIFINTGKSVHLRVALSSWVCVFILWSNSARQKEKEEVCRVATWLMLTKTLLWLINNWLFSSLHIQYHLNT